MGQQLRGVPGRSRFGDVADALFQQAELADDDLAWRAPVVQPVRLGVPRRQAEVDLQGGGQVVGDGPHDHERLGRAGAQ